jgi:hypothetical protein
MQIFSISCGKFGAEMDSVRPRMKALQPCRGSLMNGADALCETLLAAGIDVCFSNPGTSEMHFVAALDRQPRMRCVLGLFEGVVTGAADGYARMAEKPSETRAFAGVHASLPHPTKINN